MNEIPVQSLPAGIVFHPHAENKRFVDLSGKSFHFLNVLGYAGRYYWWCQCVCGTVKTVAGCALKAAGGIKSCGCKRRELVGNANRTHGMYRSDEYKIWQKMHRRCYDTNCKQYGRYGGRGIVICELWRNSFEEFYKSVGPRPSKKHSIDRIDNNGNYEPGNCKWSTMMEQTRNRSSTVFLTFNGKTMCVTDWALFLGVPAGTLYTRLNCGWSPERTLTQFVNRRTNTRGPARTFELYSHTKTVSEWAKFAGISAKTVISRLAKGWSIQDAVEKPIKLSRRHHAV